jgi:hypothetical protein
MTNPYRAMCAELLLFGEEAGDICVNESLWPKSDPNCTLLDRARTLLAQPVPEGPKPVVDYSRVPEIATEAQIRSAAQYLVKKRNCDGDLISAIEYAIARWGRPTLQPVPVSERLPRPEDCLDEGWAWFFNRRIGWRQAGLPVSPGYTHWLPANALPTPEALDD